LPTRGAWRAYTGTLGLRRVKLTINQDSLSIRRDAKGGVWLNQDDAALHHLSARRGVAR
jgi:hypothetical protein